MQLTIGAVDAKTRTASSLTKWKATLGLRKIQGAVDSTTIHWRFLHQVKHTAAFALVTHSFAYTTVITRDTPI